MLERKPKQNNKPLSIYYLCRIQKLRNITNKSLKFSATDLKHGKHHYKYLAAGKTVQGSDCTVSTRRVWLLPVQHFLPVQKENKRFSFALAAFCTPFLLVQGSAQAPDRRGVISGLQLPVQSLTSGTRTFASQPRAADWTSLHAVLRLWNASDLASDTIKITNYRAQWE